MGKWKLVNDWDRGVILEPYNEWSNDNPNDCIEIHGKCGCGNCYECKIKIKNEQKKILEDQERERKRMANLTPKEKEALKKMVREDLFKIYGIKGEL